MSHIDHIDRRRTLICHCLRETTGDPLEGLRYCMQRESS